MVLIQERSCTQISPEWQICKMNKGEESLIEWVGLIYGIAKDIKDYLQYEEKDKLVDIEWPVKSGFDEKWKQKGYQLRWSRLDKIESRRLDEWEVLYEVDKRKRVRYRLILRDGMVLIGKTS